MFFLYCWFIIIIEVIDFLLCDLGCKIKLDLVLIIDYGVLIIVFLLFMGNVDIVN